MQIACNSDLLISIHAPAKGATLSAISAGACAIYFNPRSREGSDKVTSFPAYSPSNFNPRSREGSDRVLRITCLTDEHFNPRSREGSDSK